MFGNKKIHLEKKNIELVLGIIVFLIFILFLFKLISIANSQLGPRPEIIVNNTAVEQARIYSEQLAICQNNFEELNKSVVTKRDMSELIFNLTNRSMIYIYENTNNYMGNNFYLTIQLTFIITLTFFIGLFILVDWTIFKFELARGLFNIIKKKFSKSEQQNENEIKTE